MKISEITDRSWLLENQQQGAALISRRNTGEYVLIKDGQSHVLESLDDVKQHMLNTNSVALQQPVCNNYIRGYPVNYDNPVVIENHPCGLPVFAKRTDTDVLLCAGYYAVKTHRGWSHLYCPKLSTLHKYQWRGPARSLQQSRQSVKQR